MRYRSFIHNQQNWVWNPGPTQQGWIIWPQVAPGLRWNLQASQSSEHPPHTSLYSSQCSAEHGPEPSPPQQWPPHHHQPVWPVWCWEMGESVGSDGGRVSVLNERKEVLVVMVKISITDTRSIWGTASTASWLVLLLKVVLKWLHWTSFLAFMNYIDLLSLNEPPWYLDFSLKSDSPGFLGLGLGLGSESVEMIPTHIFQEKTELNYYMLGHCATFSPRIDARSKNIH